MRVVDVNKVKGAIVDIWYKMTLRRKLFFIIISVMVIMAMSVYTNLTVFYYFVDNMQTIMDDNLSCYKFQDSLEAEVKHFTKLAMDRTLENEQVYNEARDEVKLHLENLSFDYEKVGETRYGITWSILNSYDEYEKQKQKIIDMKPSQAGYISELYKVYSMQDYLSQYSARLTREVFIEGNSYYELQVVKLKQMPYILVVIGIGAILLLFVELRVVTKSIVTVIMDLATSSMKIEKNDFSISDVRWDGEDEIGQLVNAFNKMKHSTKNYVATVEEKRQMEEQFHKQELERSELEKRFSLAQLQLIKSQINPHFLFNTLNMIARMAQEEEAAVTEEMLVAMSNLFRYSIRTSNAFAPLSQELKVVEDYMYLQQMRFGDRMRWKIDCLADLHNLDVPVFLLQPLVENAVIHGISEKEEGGSIYIKIKSKDDITYISVADTGLGIPSESLEEIRQGLKIRGKGLGIGLGNIYTRLSFYYEKVSISLDSKYGSGSVVWLEFGRRKE